MGAFVLLLFSLLFTALNFHFSSLRFESVRFTPTIEPGSRNGGGPSVTPLDSLIAQSPLVVAAIWGAIVGSIVIAVALFARSYLKHNEHLDYDDHLPADRWTRGLQEYLQLIRKEEDAKEKKG